MRTVSAPSRQRRLPGAILALLAIAAGIALLGAGPATAADGDLLRTITAADPEGCVIRGCPVARRTL